MAKKRTKTPEWLKTFSKVKKEKGEKFDSYCKQVATNYANSANEFSSTYFTKEESLTNDCFYKILDYAVVRNLVSDELVCKMEAKAIANQQCHCQETGERTTLHYDKLLKQRTEYIMSNVDEAKKMEIAEYVGNNPKEELSDIAEKFRLSNSVLRKILKEVFVNPNVDMDIPIRIELRSTRRATEEEFVRIKRQFKSLWNERDKNRELQKKES